MSRRPPAPPSVVLAGLVAVLLTGSAVGAPERLVAQEGDTAAVREADTAAAPAYMERIEESRRLGRGIILTRPGLDSLGVGTVGRAVDLMMPRPFRTENGSRCQPVVYWNGMEMMEAWHPRRSLAAETRLGRVMAIEIYPADATGRLPLEYLEEECGVIALWVQNPPDSRAESSLGRLAILLLAGLVFFFSVGS